MVVYKNTEKLSSAVGNVFLTLYYIQKSYDVHAGLEN